MNAKSLITLIILFVLLNAGLFLILNKDAFLKKESKPANITQNPAPPTITLPIDPKNPSVKSLNLTYNFEGKVTEIKLSNNSTIIKIDNSTPEIPGFLVNKETKVFKLQGSESVPSKIEDIKVGDDIGIGMVYRVKEKALEVISVYIK